MRQNSPYLGKLLVMTAAMQASLYLYPFTVASSPKTQDLLERLQTNATAASLSLFSLGIERRSHWAMMAKRELVALAQTHPSWRTAFDLAEMVLLVLNDAELK